VPDQPLLVSIVAGVELLITQNVTIEKMCGVAGDTDEACICAVCGAALPSERGPAKGCDLRVKDRRALRISKVDLTFIIMYIKAVSDHYYGH
jgi:hypothetical protein